MVIYYGMKITITCSQMIRHLRETNIVTSVDLSGGKCWKLLSAIYVNVEWYVVLHYVTLRYVKFS